MNDVEQAYYADGEDAYDMRKPFKDVKSKPAILPKGSGQSKTKEAKKIPSKPLDTNQASASQTGNDLQTPTEAADKI